MPVRIIFRGLILFHFPEDGDDKGKLVAMLVNNPAFIPNPSEPGPKPGRGPHEHSHAAEIQLLEGGDTGADFRPIALKPHDVVDIVIPGAKGTSRAPSFDMYVPNLGQIIAKGTPAVRNVGWGRPNANLIQNYVIVDRGVARVREVAVWDESGYPLSGKRADRGLRPSSPVIAKFMGSTVQGHMASEVIVEVDDAESAEVRFHPEPGRTKKPKGTKRPNHRVSPDTVEILITNYEFQRGGPVPWSLDFQWMFEVAGYQPVDLAGPEFRLWEELGEQYQPDLFKSDRDLLLKGTTGLPFPYVVPGNPLVQFQPLTDEHDRPLCITALVETSVRRTLPDGSIVTQTFKVEVPRPKTDSTTTSSTAGPQS